LAPFSALVLTSVFSATGNCLSLRHGYVNSL
jgi:hypothetical protein